MAVHHDKLLKFLRDHDTAAKCKADTRYNWCVVGSDFDSIAGTFAMLKDEILSGVLD